MNSVLEGEKLVGRSEPSSLPLLKATLYQAATFYTLSLPSPPNRRIKSLHVVEGGRIRGRRRIEEATKMSPFDFALSRSSSSSKVQFPVLNVPKCRLLQLPDKPTLQSHATLYLLGFSWLFFFSFLSWQVGNVEGWIGRRTLELHFIYGESQGSNWWPILLSMILFFYLRIFGKMDVVFFGSIVDPKAWKFYSDYLFRSLCQIMRRKFGNYFLYDVE